MDNINGDGNRSDLTEKPQNVTQEPAFLRILLVAVFITFLSVFIAIGLYIYSSKGPKEPIYTHLNSTTQ